MKKLVIALLGFSLMPAFAFASEAAEAHAEAAGGGIMDSPIIPAMVEFIPMLLTFALVLFVLVKFVWPIVLKVLDERAEKIEGSLKKAEEAKIEAEGILNDSQDKLGEARKESASIVESGKAAGEAARAEIIAKAEAEAAEIVERGHASVEAERKAAVAGLKEESARLAIAIASKILGEKINDDIDAKIIKASIAEMGGFND